MLEEFDVQFVSGHSSLIVEDWPMGNGRRATAEFYCEQRANKNKWRVCRTTTLRGKKSQPKRVTYGDRAMILQGDDGKTYPAVHSSEGMNMWKVYDSALKYSVVSAWDGSDRYDQIDNLYNS